MPPLLSVIVTITNGENHLDRCLEALALQVDAPPLEIIVPVYASIENVEKLRARWPKVVFVEVAGTPPSNRGMSHWLYDRRRATGLGRATGDLIAITEDHAIPEPSWCARIVELHRSPYAVIGGAIEHAGSGPLSWAAHFVDYGRYQKPFPASAVSYVSDVNVAYKRQALMACQHLWKDYYHETAVHGWLQEQGETLWLTPHLMVEHNRGRMRFASILPERVHWGRVFAGRRAQSMRLTQRIFFAAATAALPVLLLARRTREVLSRGAHVRPFLTSAPAVFLLLCAWACGELAGYATARPFPKDPD